ncbi:MAG: phenol hydroxylase, partial [Marinobacter sp.]
KIDEWFGEQGAEDVSMLTEFMRDWFKESLRWTNAMIKTVVAESDGNKEQIQAWIDHWEPRAYEALLPIANETTGRDALDQIRTEFSARIKKLGVEVKITQSEGVPA